MNDSTTIKPGCEVCSALHLLLRRAGGMKHTLLALPAAAGICAVVLSTNAALILVALPAWSMLVNNNIALLLCVLLPSLVADHDHQHQAEAAAAATTTAPATAGPLHLQLLLLQLAHVLLLLQPALAATSSSISSYSFCSCCLPPG